jgi:hypothetical protein
MNHVSRSILIGLSILVIGSAQVHGQSRWTVECRPSLNVPASYLLGKKMNIGFGFDGQLGYRFLPGTSLYAGCGWTLFPQQEITNEETGFMFGVQFMRPIFDSEVRYYFKGGGVYDRLKIQNNNHQFSNSGRELGWLIESGLSLPLDYGLALNPGLRYRQLSGEISMNHISQKFNLNYLSLGISVSKTFR